jgi:hypothetical protein
MKQIYIKNALESILENTEGTKKTMEKLSKMNKFQAQNSYLNKFASRTRKVCMRKNRTSL